MMVLEHHLCCVISQELDALSGQQQWVQVIAVEI
jgi:hypothetical protein